MKLLAGIVLVLTLLLLTNGPVLAAVIADHQAAAEFDQVPGSFLDSIDGNQEFTIFYGRTSHGSQINRGIEQFNYSTPISHNVSDDLGHNGDTSWEQPTRDWLDEHSNYNVVMWSWCGGVSDNTESGIETYLNTMSQLEEDYEGVTFVYMTGHLDGTGSSGNLHQRNEQIRQYCRENNKVLFDFADIETWTPNGDNCLDGCSWNDNRDESDYCYWCYDWCSSHSCPSCSCAHSHCFNCYQKGKAFWWLMARLAGWGAEETPTPTPAPGLIEKALTVFQNWGSSGPGDYYNDGLVNSLDFAQALL